MAPRNMLATIVFSFFVTTRHAYRDISLNDTHNSQSTQRYTKLENRHTYTLPETNPIITKRYTRQKRYAQGIKIETRTSCSIQNLLSQNDTHVKSNTRDTYDTRVLEMHEFILRS